MAYLHIQKEETLKAQVFADYFDPSRCAYTPNIGNIDFIAASALFETAAHYLWAEAKKGIRDIFDMLTQALLTCKKTYDSGGYLPPPFIGCFDAVKIAFVPFHDILPIFADPDVNWNATPSNYLSADFLKLREKIERLTKKNIVIFSFDEDSAELKDFIKKNIVSGSRENTKSPITKNNFTHIFYKWVKEVKPFINISQDEWAEFKKQGIEDCDFFRADMMSSGGTSIVKKLKILLEHDNYTLEEELRGRFYFTDIDFTDGGAAYRRFWNRYDRPPAEEYQQYIIDRRDLLVPQNIREVKGSFYTPAIWVEKSQEYLAKVFGENWQDEYYIWDCAAGTGNLLAGLTNKYNIWASDIDAGNINTMRELIDGGLNLLPDHVFRFDFLNDDFKNLPEGLKTIINDPEKCRKLIVYINPPYAEASSATTPAGTGKNKQKVASAHKTSEIYKKTLGRGINELFANFFVKIYHLLPDAKLASFSTLKYINSQNFTKFREYFLAEYKAGFICCADTFDNVKGKFPIGFLVWNFENKQPIRNVTVDIYEHEKERCRLNGRKTVYTITEKTYIVDWLRNYFEKSGTRIGYLRFQGTDFQTSSNAFFTSSPTENDIRESKITNITNSNLIEVCIYLSVRHCIAPTWINNRDQFLYPNDNYKTDTYFQNDSLVFTLFHGQNKISSKDGVNHWIPFIEKEVDAKETFSSNFMSSFLKGKIFSPEAQAVLSAGKALWKYYHAKIKGNKTVSVNASFYDIRAFFQGRKDSGAMNTKSIDEDYNALIKALREAHKTLASKIEPKVYEYGFLKE